MSYCNDVSNWVGVGYVGVDRDWSTLIMTGDWDITYTCSLLSDLANIYPSSSSNDQSQRF